MRRFSTICALVAYVLLLEHAIVVTIECAIHQAGAWPLPVKALFLLALALHALTSLILMVKGTKDRTRAAAGRPMPSYAGLNRAIWTRRVSGLAVLVLVLFHIVSNVFFKPALFLPVVRGTQALVPGLLFVLLCVALLLHLVNSIEPMFIGLGVKPARWVVVLLEALVALVLVVCAVVMVCVMGGIL